MKFFVPFVEPQHREAVIKRLAKEAGTTVSERKIRVLHFPGEDGKNRSAVVGKALRSDGRIVAAILPLDRGGYSVVLADPDGVIRKTDHITVAATDVDYYSVKYFDPPNDIEAMSGSTDDIRKRLTARRKLFGKAQATAAKEGIAWGDALKKALLDPKNFELVAAAQEPRKPRAPRQRLSDAELKKRIRELDGSNEPATAIKQVRAGGGRVVSHRDPLK